MCICGCMCVCVCKRDCIFWTYSLFGVLCMNAVCEQMQPKKSGLVAPSPNAMCVECKKIIGKIQVSLPLSFFFGSTHYDASKVSCFWWCCIWGWVGVGVWLGWARGVWGGVWDVGVGTGVCAFFSAWRHFAFTSSHLNTQIHVPLLKAFNATHTLAHTHTHMNTYTHTHTHTHTLFFSLSHTQDAVAAENSTYGKELQDFFDTKICPQVPPGVLFCLFLFFCHWPRMPTQWSLNP